MNGELERLHRKIDDGFEGLKESVRDSHAEILGRLTEGEVKFENLRVRLRTVERALYLVGATAGGALLLTAIEKLFGGG